MQSVLSSVSPRLGSLLFFVFSVSFSFLFPRSGLLDSKARVKYAFRGQSCETLSRETLWCRAHLLHPAFRGETLKVSSLKPRALIHREISFTPRQLRVVVSRKHIFYSFLLRVFNSRTAAECAFALDYSMSRVSRSTHVPCKFET